MPQLSQLKQRECQAVLRQLFVLLLVLLLAAAIAVFVILVRGCDSFLQLQVRLPIRFLRANKQGIRVKRTTDGDVIACQSMSPTPSTVVAYGDGLCLPPIKLVASERLADGPVQLGVA